MIGVRSSGSFKNIEKFFDSVSRGTIFNDLDHLGRRGVEALSRATPQDTGRTAMSWEYRIVNKAGRRGIEWYNTNTNDGVNIAILLQYGHGTGTGGWVTGYDYINPAIRPIFDQIADEVWKKVTYA